MHRPLQNMYIRAVQRVCSWQGRLGPVREPTRRDQTGLGSTISRKITLSARFLALEIAFFVKCLYVWMYVCVCGNWTALK